jgi:hypothetical protein
MKRLPALLLVAAVFAGCQKPDFLKTPEEKAKETATPAPTPQPTPKPGDWLFKRKGPLDQPTTPRRR